MPNLRKLIYHAYRLISSARYRTTRRFTRPGIAVLVGLFVSAAVGVDMEQTVTGERHG